MEKIPEKCLRMGFAYSDAIYSEYLETTSKLAVYVRYLLLQNLAFPVLQQFYPAGVNTNREQIKVAPCRVISFCFSLVISLYELSLFV